jgi:hypothetical protein
VSWCVDEVDLVVVPVEGDGGGADGDAAGALLWQVVHSGGALVDLARLGEGAGVEEHALGCGGFAGVDVCDYADVAD